jgi:hypothetical protein
MVAPLLYLVSEQAASITRHRVVAAWWDPEKSPEENLEHAGAPIGWPGLQAVPTEADKVLGGRTH